MREDMIVAKYRIWLAELKMNSKPLINLLTTMAEDYIRHAPVIVQVIEKHLETVNVEIKLPVLYVLDSILKNVGKDYKELITKNIISSFCGVFEKADDKTRALLFKLRMSWRDYIPAKKLYVIDVRSRQLDPNWPIMATLSPKLELLRRVLCTPANTESDGVTPQTSTSTSSALSSFDFSRTSGEADLEMQKELLEKQKKLLQLQMRKVEQELLQAELQRETGSQSQSKELEELQTQEGTPEKQRQSSETWAIGKPPSEMQSAHSSPRKKVKVQSAQDSNCPSGSNGVSSVSESSKEPGITTTTAQETSAYEFDPEFEAWLMDIMFPFPFQSK